MNTVAMDPMSSLRAIEQIAVRAGRNGPELSVDTVLERLASRYGMDDAAELMRRAFRPDAITET